MIKYTLPDYPVLEDMWDILKNEKRPIIIYGMGNGADKLIARFDKLGIEYADIFASDGFVRGHSFHGTRVKSFSEIKTLYSDFVIVLSFASSREEVLTLLSAMDKEHDLLIPDMPVASEEYFDKVFYNTNYSRIKAVYNLLEDDLSRDIYAACIRYKLSGKLSYLTDSYCTTEDIYNLIGKEHKVTVDGGAYNGDTVREVLKFFENPKKIYAVEPDKRNYRKLSAFSEGYEGKTEIVPINAGLWSTDTEGSFIGSGNRNSSVSSTASFKKREENVSLLRIDNIVSEAVDYIKLDVEGAEREALIGSHGVISNYMPTMLISAYHKSEDIFALAELVADKYKGYKFFIRRTLCVPAWEIALIVKT